MKVSELPRELLLMHGCGNGAVFDVNPEEAERLHSLSEYEIKLWQSGIGLVAGVDEVGRGPIAGPVVAAAVILPQGCLLPGVNDSKKLSARKRYALEPLIKQAAVAWAVGAVGVYDIDRYNILQATKMAMRKALRLLPVAAEHLLIDAVRLDGCDLPQTPIIKGDAKSISIGAASILAKCHRDRMMEIYDELYPGYDLGKHAGYPTPAHKQAVWAIGQSPIHRKSFVLKTPKSRPQQKHTEAKEQDNI